MLFFLKLLIPKLSHVYQSKMSEKTFAEVEKFDAHKLKHVETQEKNPLPTSDGKMLLHISWAYFWTSDMARGRSRAFPLALTISCAIFVF